ncbi:hypothetical protein D3C76_1659030 [compost metagenome]
MKRDGRRIDRLSHQLPDPVVDAIRLLQEELDGLRMELDRVKSENKQLQEKEIPVQIE